MRRKIVTIPIHNETCAAVYRGIVTRGGVVTPCPGLWACGPSGLLVHNIISKEIRVIDYVELHFNSGSRYSHLHTFPFSHLPAVLRPSTPMPMVGISLCSTFDLLSTNSGNTPSSTERPHLPTLSSPALPLTDQSPPQKLRPNSYRKWQWLPR